MRASVLHLLRRLRGEENGQSLIVVALAMFVVIGISAMSIDVASWYQKHHQAQVVADAAALAAANCLANPGEASGLGPSCTSGTDTTDATTVAEDYAAHNGVRISASNISFSGSTVTITATNTATPLFANLLGIHTATQTASSAAGWSTGSTACTAAAQAAGECYAIYAADATCGSNNGFINDETGETITGAVHSQGSMNVGNGTFWFNGPITYSSGNCTYTVEQNGTEMGKYTPTAGDNEPASYWPLDYSKVFPACSATGTYQCTTVAGIAGVPSYCTDATTNTSGFRFGWITSANEEPTSGNVYCSIGTGTVSNPATWNGPIIFADGASAGSSSSPVSATFIGGYVNATSSDVYVQPAASASNCLVYATDTDSAAGGDAIEWGNGNYLLDGTMFAPNGSINLNSTSSTAAFLEAQNVNIQNLSFTGDGPTVNATGASGGSTDSLVG